MTNKSIPPNDKATNRERIESLYLLRKITKEEFLSWLNLGDHYVKN